MGEQETVCTQIITSAANLSSIISKNIDFMENGSLIIANCNIIHDQMVFLKQSYEKKEAHLVKYKEDVDMKIKKAIEILISCDVSSIPEAVNQLTILITNIYEF